MRACPEAFEEFDRAVCRLEHDMREARMRAVENPDRMVTAKQAALELGITVDMVNGWAKQHPDLIHREKRGNRAFFHLGSLVEYRDLHWKRR